MALDVGGPSPPPANPTADARPHRGGAPAHQRRRPGRPGRSLLVYLAAGCGYLGLSVVLWWHVWTAQPTSTATCGCGDPALFTWFLEWPAYAISHGHNLFYSTALFHPGGINLLSNTSVLAVGVPLTPVTWLFGPVAALNVANTAMPVLSALAAFWVLGRWVRWCPAAFVGGLLFGFSPFVLESLGYSHLMTSSLALLPLMLACFDELLVRQRYSAWWLGTALGLLAVVEFFVSTEVLVIVVMASVMGIVLLVAGLAVGHRRELVARAGYAGRGLGTAGVVAVTLLAYPTWFALAGPAHLSGRIWPNIPVIGGYTARSFVSPTPADSKSLLLEIGGYLGRPLPSSSYIGWGIVVVLVAGTLVWRRDRRLWFFGALGLVTAVFSLGERAHQWVPWQLFDRAPVLDNVVEQRFVAVTYLCLAVALAVILDHCRWAFAADRVADDAPGRPPGTARAGGSAMTRWVLPFGAVVVAAAVALGPIVAAVAPTMPFAARPVDLPQWFAVQGPRLAPGRVLLAMPTPFSGIQSAMAWQAVNRLHYAQAGGGGPQGTPGRAGREEPGFVLLAALGFGFNRPPAGTRGQYAAVRQALGAWGVTTVVIPDRRGPAILDGHDPHYAVGFMTAALGQVPDYQDHAWVWPAVDLGRGALEVPVGTLAACNTLAVGNPGRPSVMAGCVAAAARHRSSGRPRA